MFNLPDPELRFLYRGIGGFGGFVDGPPLPRLHKYRYFGVGRGSVATTADSSADRKFQVSFIPHCSSKVLACLRGRAPAGCRRLAGLCTAERPSRPSDVRVNNNKPRAGNAALDLPIPEEQCVHCPVRREGQDTYGIGTSTSWYYGVPAVPWARLAAPS